MTFQKPTISIVTPCFNSAAYIRECLESVACDPYSRVEHVIKDAGSTDGTADIIAEYASRYPERVMWVSQPDNGQADGLNEAFKHVGGDIILVLNADDALVPGACEWAAKQMARYPDSAVIYGDVNIIDEHSRAIETFRAHPYDFERLLCVELVPPAQAAFIRRSALEQVGFYADKEIDTCPDYEMWVRLGLRFPFRHIPGVVTRYRRHPQALDSGAPRTADRFYESKKLVMDRVFSSPRTPVHIRKLRRRAYGGLSLWTASAEYGMSPRGLASLSLWKYVLSGLGYYGISGYAKRFVSIGSAYISLWIKRIVRDALKTLLQMLPRRVLQLLGGCCRTREGRGADTGRASLFARVGRKWTKLVAECLETRNNRTI